jgi:hypothetical protein
MAKKSRRARSRQPGQTSRPSPSAPAPPPSGEGIEDRGDASQGTKKQVDFRAEYAYVLTDLRQMGVIALAMFAVLVALSFVIH